MNTQLDKSKPIGIWIKSSEGWDAGIINGGNSNLIYLKIVPDCYIYFEYVDTRDIGKFIYWAQSFNLKWGLRSLPDTTPEVFEKFVEEVKNYD